MRTNNREYVNCNLSCTYKYTLDKGVTLDGIACEAGGGYARIDTRTPLIEGKEDVQRV